MPAADSAALVVARFLKTNQYLETYDTFIREAGLAEDAGSCSPHDLTLEALLDEKKRFDLSTQFEKTRISDETATQWTALAPKDSHALSCLRPMRANVLCAVVADIIDDRPSPTAQLLVSTADRRLSRLDLSTETLKASSSALHDSPILSVAVLNHKILLTTSMSGELLASDIHGNIINRRKDHTKYAVQVVTYTSQNTTLIATAAWDNTICIYNPSRLPNFALNDPFARISLLSKPHSILFIQHPDSLEPILLVTRSDSSHLYYYTVEAEPRLLGKQNLAPQSNTWVAFTPSSIANCPLDPCLLAVGVSSVPHMKLLIVRLLVPPTDLPTSSTAHMPASSHTSLLENPDVLASRASQARAIVALEEREAAAIEVCCTTMAPQSAYSTPVVAWRPDGTGVWVNGDDGAIRGIEASSGKVVCTLRGHDESTKVRCLWSGHVKCDDGGQEKELLVSGGFDQRLLLWKT